MQLNEAVSKRLLELLSNRHMTQYQLFARSGVPKSTISNIINCSYESVKLRILYEICQGLDITLSDFFQSPLFDSKQLEP
ncbi:MAG: helix-turn-helix transcriptional regulator [Emergencia sp.]|jgi:transcriptional regulator with XRE-family HTH domain|nr:helix-turn-helix transcriptional regulator [Emergencia sp.]